MKGKRGKKKENRIRKGKIEIRNMKEKRRKIKSKNIYKRKKKKKVRLVVYFSDAVQSQPLAVQVPDLPGSNINHCDYS